MKKIILLLALIAVSQCFLQRRPEPQPSSDSHRLDIINGTLVNLNLWYNGLFAYYNLQQTEVIECYTSFAAADYFQELLAEWRLANATAQADKSSMETWGALVITLNATLNSTLQCVYDTNDFIDLQIAAHVNVFNRGLSIMLRNLYYQAYYGEWFNVMDPIVDYLQNQQFFQAGKLYGALFELIADNSTHQNEYYMAYKAFLNGVFLYNNISEPQAMPACYNYTTAQNAFNFYYYWARAVNGSNLANAINNTIAYFQTAGDQLERLVAPERTCESSTSEYQTLSNVIGASIYSSQFRENVLSYIEADVVNYVTTFLEISTFFQANSADAAGSGFAGFFAQVVNWAANQNVNINA